MHPKNDYTIALKGNQKKLLKAALKLSENSPAISENQTVDISHGRQIVRKVSVFNIESLKSEGFKLSEWSNIRRLIKVERSGTRGKKNTNMKLITLAAYLPMPKHLRQKLEDTG